MKFVGEQVLLRIYLLSTDQTHLVASYEWIVRRARKRGMAGATVLRGIHGFGRRGIVGAASQWRLAQPAPVIVEIVDAAVTLVQFIEEEIASHASHGLMTLERAAVMMYRRRGDDSHTEPLQLLSQIKDLSTVPDLSGRLAMKTHTDGILLRVFAGESDMHDGKPLYQAVVSKARELGMAGATILQGTMGFGANSVLHTAKVLELSTDLPIVMEFVDSEENIRKLLPVLDGIVHEGLITMEAVRIVAYRHNPADAPQ
jgi:uncharacterized protein